MSGTSPKGCRCCSTKKATTPTRRPTARRRGKRLQSGEFGLVLADLKMPGMDGLELFARMREAALDSEIIIITGKGTVTSAVEAMRNGAYDYLTKPLDLERLKALIPRALEKYQVKTANRELQKRLESLTRYGEMLGQSDEMRAHLQHHRSGRTVERERADRRRKRHRQGAGRARDCTRSRARKRGPFIALNCGAFPREILENELFGHEKGAFTGAINEKPGAFELADGGTLFLDEVAEMEPDIQVKFLRALEQRAFRRLGGKKEIEVDIRVVAATNKNIEDALREGKLREDLYHRLAVIPMHLPPLRERGGDVRLLAEEFLQRFSKEQGKDIKGFSEGATRTSRPTAGRATSASSRTPVERAVILAPGDVIEVDATPAQHVIRR